MSGNGEATANGSVTAAAATLIPASPVVPGLPTPVVVDPTPKPVLPSTQLAGVNQQLSVPADFGADNGPGVSNAKTIWGDIDSALGRKKPPALEYIFVEPYSSIPLPFGMALSPNSFGHALVKYTLPTTGEQKVMNICGGSKFSTIVQFTSPEDYFFSTSYSGTVPGVDQSNSEQRGLYNREMISVRVEDLPPERILAMHEYFVSLQDQSKSKRAYFNIAFGTCYAVAVLIINLLSFLLY